ncbi:MAG TPA: AIR synthase-related protein, partial [Bacillota bacterium]|nr:AIR synthase-related protein [Bacillota bacterium]
EADGIFINTAGVGFVNPQYRFAPDNIRSGDRIILNGSVGEHGTAVFAKRLGVSFKPELLSDSAPLAQSVAALLAAGITPRVMRDITRGGLATIICELVAGSGYNAHLDEKAIPIDPRVKRACDIWGFDPLHVASEGRFVLVVEPDKAEAAVAVLKTVEASGGAAIIGEITEGKGRSAIRTEIGGKRLIHPLPDELLPRIC